MITSNTGSQQSTSQRIALLIDYQSLDDSFPEHVNKVTNFARGRGRLCIAKAYGNWSHIKQSKIWLLSEASIDLVALHYSSDVSVHSSNIRLAIDATEIAAAHAEIGTFVLVAHDASVYLPLVEHLRCQSRYVCLVNENTRRCSSLAGYCDEYIPLSRILGTNASAIPESTDKFTILRRAIVAFACRDLLPMNELRSRILQLDPAFHSSEFGYHSFEDYLADAARAGIIEVDRRSSHGAIVASKSVGRRPKEPSE